MKHITVLLLALCVFVSIGAIADASFYMTGKSGNITATVTSPPQLVLGSQYEVTIPFPNAANMYAHRLVSYSCDMGTTALVKNWALLIPEKLNFKSSNGPILKFKSVDGWRVIDKQAINNSTFLVLWSNNEEPSVTCNVFLNSYLDKWASHTFGGTANIIYEVIDPGLPGQGGITLPSGDNPGFSYANLRRETNVPVAEMQRRLFSMPDAFSSNTIIAPISWDTKQTCALDSNNINIDFGTVTTSDFYGKKKNTYLTVSCKGGTETHARVEVLDQNGLFTNNEVNLGHGIHADISMDSLPDITIPLDGEKKLNITATLRGKPEGVGSLSGNAIIKVTFP